MDSIFCRKKNRSGKILFDGEPTATSSGRKIAEKQDLSRKSGFQTIQDRLAALTEVGRHKRRDEAQKSSTRVSGRGGKKEPQFATLNELFSNTSRQQRQYHDDGRRRTKIPVMKLNKSDWNVRCWEDRLQGIKRKPEASDKMIEMEKPERRVDAFRGRIDDVSVKLQKIRDGAPLDEKLYELEKMDNKLGTIKPMGPTIKSSHEWTDLLKDELNRNIHDRRALRSELDKASCKSPLGRPIRKIFDDESDENDSEVNRSDKADRSIGKLN